MSWLEITFEADEKLSELIEAFLWLNNAHAVTIEDLGDQAIYEPKLGTTPIWIENKVTGLFDADFDSEKLLDDLRSHIQDPLPQYHLKKIEDKPWERQWLEHFKAMEFGKRLIVQPQVDETQNNHLNDEDKVVLKMDPGLAFGTGTHETTALCLKWLSDHKIDELDVLDFGCGSGILGIAAKLLGCQSLTATDIDPQAISATLSNAERNDLKNDLQIISIEEFKADESENIEKFDLILANILAEPLKSLAEDFAKYLKSDGTIILSGILRGQCEEIKAAYSKDFADFEVEYLGDWSRIKAKRKKE